MNAPNFFFTGLLSSLRFVYALVAQQSDVKAPSRTLFRFVTIALVLAHFVRHIRNSNLLQFPGMVLSPSYLERTSLLPVGVF